MEIGIDELIQMLLYVPFNKDYDLVGINIKKSLTEDEYFGQCFLKPEFDEEIAKVINSSENEVSGFDWDLDNETRILQLERFKNDFTKIKSWINTCEKHMFVIKGDAGTGKSTFLHYLKHEYRNSNISWHIIDIQNAADSVRIQQKEIKIPQSNLYLRAISAILIYITSSIFIEDKDTKELLVDETEQRINGVVKKYHDKFDKINPREEITDFFITAMSPAKIPEDSSITFCRQCASNIEEWCTHILANDNLDDSWKFALFVELLIYFSLCSDNCTRRIFAFDNFERFIGTDEIYDGQLTQFVDSLRKIQDSIYTNNSHLQGSYQVLLLMRNTSTRMITNLQIADLLVHNIDLSGWFDAGIILKKKINWYNDHNIHVERAETILSIFNDMGLKGDTLRGLHYKISMLFNYNKRIIISFLVNVLFSPRNEIYLKTYESYWNNQNNVSSHLNRFAARSIIFRLVLNALRDDGFFVNIVAQAPCIGSDQGNNDTSLGYARKILTILHEYDINRLGNETSRYMPLRDVINTLFPTSPNSYDLLLDEANIHRAELIAKVLYYMNYYNPRKKNYLQLIDLQYNDTSNDTLLLHDDKQLLDYIRSSPDKIKLRITNAGKAYLYFVVYYFEFFACKSRHKQNQIRYFPDSDTPPLLYAIPTKEILMQTDSVEKLTCVKIIKVVSAEAFSCIRTMNNSDNQFNFRPNLNSTSISHQQRIVNSHSGFINNFIEFLNEYFSGESFESDIDFKDKYGQLVKILQDFRDSYNPNMR